MDGKALFDVFINWFPMVLIFGIWMIFLRRLYRPGPGRVPAYMQPSLDELKKQTALLERIARGLEASR